jgi:NAD(P)-dependent dehydrogenase (short-subunit alcohol dehydrogenase family)
MTMPNPKEAGKKQDFAGEPTQESPGSESRMKVKPDHGEMSYVGLGRLTGRVALVTGGDSGIGRAVALAFAREGADVAIGYLNEEKDAEESKRWVDAAGRKSILLPGDLADASHCARIVEETVKKLGAIDILVNNAAFQRKAVDKFEDIDAEGLQRTFRVNVLAMFYTVKAALRHMKPGSAIINTASIQAYHPNASVLDYAATKGAIVTFTKGLAQEVIDRGIRANIVAPGPVWTSLVAASFDAKKLEHFGESYPYGRPAQPVELAPAYVFLACDESRYISGEVLGVTGGKPLA